VSSASHGMPKRSDARLSQPEPLAGRRSTALIHRRRPSAPRTVTMSQRGRRHKTTCAPNGAKVGVGRFLHYDPVVPVCAHCGEDNPGRAKFCLACGSPLAVMSPRGDERKVVSVLFCDLVGFTSRAERLDVEDVGGLLRPYYTRLRIELERYGGTVEKFIGDAVMALFGAPVSHEDDPARAVRAALAIRNAITELNEGDLHVRIGVTTGEALVSLDARPLQGEGMASGDVVNTAARLQAAAPVDGVLVDEPTYRATKRQFRYSDAEPVRAKGKATPVPTWQALGGACRPGEVDGPYESGTKVVTIQARHPGLRSHPLQKLA
jgi:class 3 adenylate cyclase